MRLVPRKPNSRVSNAASRAGDPDGEQAYPRSRRPVTAGGHLTCSCCWRAGGASSSRRRARLERRSGAARLPGSARCGQNAIRAIALKAVPDRSSIPLNVRACPHG